MQRRPDQNAAGFTPASLNRIRVIWFYLIALFFYLAAALRLVGEIEWQPWRTWMFGLLGLYALLLVTERLISSRLPLYQHVYFLLQIVVVLAMITLRPKIDYYPTLFVALCIQAIWFAPQRAAIFWISMMLICTTLSEMYMFGVLGGLSFAVTYIAAGLFISLFGILTLRTERARAESQALLVELQEAHRKLKIYAEQVEALSAAQERTRLARELHDSVTQTIFSITLTAQAARMLLDRDPARVAGQLDHLQKLSQSALAEMRALIQQLHPRSVAEEGLAAALRRHAAERFDQDGLQVDLVTRGSQRLPAETEEGLFRVIQEALNNVVKHSGTNRAEVTVDLSGPALCVEIADQGKGFDPRGAGGQSSHLGLTSMRERVEALGGKLLIDSHPGRGTRVRIDGIAIKEQEHVG